MGDHVYAVTELVGTSKKSIEGAIQGAVGTAADSLHHLEWLEVTRIRGHVEDGVVAHYQFVPKVGFRYAK